MDKKLFIIDGNSILYREYYALPNLTNKFGDYTGAVFGFAKIMVEIITKFNPSHIAVAFDAGKHTFRNDLYDGYKATRKPMPEDLRSQIEPVKNMLKLMNIKTIEQVGIEGDDVIGSLSRMFDIKKVIVTGDRDSYQLVNDNTTVFLNKKGLSDIKILDEKALMDEFNLTPQQMVFLKALQGDTSDNIPGVKGVGEKTALGLIQKYGDLDGVYSHIDEIKGTLKTKLETDKENAYMSLDLAKIKCDAKLDVTLDELEVVFPFSNEVKEFFSYNGFNSLLKKEDIFELTSVGALKKTPSIEIKEIEKAEELKSVLANVREIGLCKENESFHVSILGKEYIYKIDPLFNRSEENFMQALKPILENEQVRKVLFDSKNERHRCAEFGINLSGEVFDVMIAKHLVLGESVTKLLDVIEVEEDLKQAATILVGDAIELEENLERMGMMKLYRELELPLSVVLFEMEQTGFKIDKKRLAELDQKYDEEIEKLTNEIYGVVGREFNINSPKQLSEIIYDELALSKSKKKSTASDVLEQLVDRHPLIPLVIRYRKVAKFSSGFIKNMYSHLDENGYVHTKLNQTLTTTGRLSSSDPNLQNLPIRSEESREIRSMFVASDESRVLVDVDYSQIELRILAHVTGDDILLKAFNEGLDVHTQTAMDIFGLPASLITHDMRRQAKVVNFGIIYGISDFGLASDLKIPVYEAKKYIENFFIAHPKVKDFMENSVNIAKSTGRASTILGRTRKMNDINSSNFMIRSRAERATYNMPIQGSASDIIKLAMLKVDEALKKSKTGAKLIMQVHDELIVDTPMNKKDEVLKLVKDCMQNAIKLTVPLDSDGSVGYRWSEGH